MKWSKDCKKVYKTIAIRVADYERDYLWEVSGGNMSKLIRSRLAPELEKANELHGQQKEKVCSIG